MRVLLDTHAFLWAGLCDPRLSAQARSVFEDPDKEIFLSPASFWETAIKISLGKNRLRESLKDFVEGQMHQNRLSLLPITPAHANMISRMAFHHGDPFDRMLVAQALVEQLPLLSADRTLDTYGVTRWW